MLQEIPRWTICTLNKIMAAIPAQAPHFFKVAVTTKSFKFIVCYYCKKDGHMMSSCMEMMKKRRSTGLVAALNSAPQPVCDALVRVWGSNHGKSWYWPFPAICYWDVWAFYPPGPSCSKAGFPADKYSQNLVFPWILLSTLWITGARVLLHSLVTCLMLYQSRFCEMQVLHNLCF